MTVNPKKDALTSGDLAGAIPDDYVATVNKNAKFAAGDVAYCRTFDCKARVLTVATTKSGACNYKVALYSKSGQKTGEAVCTEAELVKTATRGMKGSKQNPRYSLTPELAAINKENEPLIADNSRLVSLRWRAEDAGDKKLVREIQRKMNVNHKKIEANDARFEAIQAQREKDWRLEMIADSFGNMGRELAKQQGRRSLKLTGVASGASQACTVAANALAAMVTKNKINLPLAQKLIRGIQREFPEARVQNALSYMRDGNASGLSTASTILKAEANRLRAQGKAMKASGKEQAVLAAAASALKLARGVMSSIQRLSQIADDNLSDKSQFANQVKTQALQLANLLDQHDSDMSLVGSFARVPNAGLLSGAGYDLKNTLPRFPAGGDAPVSHFEATRRYLEQLTPVLAALGKGLRAKSASKFTVTTYSDTYANFERVFSPLTRIIDSLKQSGTCNPADFDAVIDPVYRASVVPDMARARSILSNSFTQLKRLKPLSQQPDKAAQVARALEKIRTQLFKARGMADPVHVHKSMKAMRASVKRAPATAIPMIAPLQSKLLMLYRKFVATPEQTSLGFVPSFAAQWKSIADDLPAEEQSGVRLIVRDLMSAYRAFANQQVKNVAYFLAMALGTANKMVGGSDSVPIPRHLRTVTKAADAKQYFDTHKQIPRGSIFKVNGKIYELERNNGYVISGFEYKKPWSTSTRVVVDLRNDTAQLLSVGNGTVRGGRDGSVIFGRRPATLNVHRKPPAA